MQNKHTKISKNILMQPEISMEQLLGHLTGEAPLEKPNRNFATQNSEPLDNDFLSKEDLGENPKSTESFDIIPVIALEKDSEVKGLTTDHIYVDRETDEETSEIINNSNGGFHIGIDLAKDGDSWKVDPEHHKFIPFEKEAVTQEFEYKHVAHKSDMDQLKKQSKAEQDTTNDFDLVSKPEFKSVEIDSALVKNKPITTKPSEKLIHVKPAFYAFVYEELKLVAKEFGYNLVLHGSLNRDLDLIAIPWSEPLGNVDKMIQAFSDLVGGYIMGQTFKQRHCFPHGRLSYVINLNRSNSLVTSKLDEEVYKDAEYYIDISVIPPSETLTPKHLTDNI